MAEAKPAEEQSSALSKLPSAVEKFQAVFTKNRERVDRAVMAAKSIAAVDNEAQDKVANNFLIKAGVTFKEIQEERLSATRIIDDAKAWAMGPEKELAAEMERIKKLRNDRNKKIADDAKAEEQRIEMEKQYAIYEGKVKAAMQASLESGVVTKLSELENAIAGLFNKATLPEISKLTNGLKITPKLAIEYYDKILRVPYDQRIMSTDKFEELILRAKAYKNWQYENINTEYAKKANEILDKWREKIPAKKKELETIAAGGEKAEKVKEQSENNARAETERRKAQEATAQADIQRKAQEEEQKNALTAEFDAQVAQQGVATPEGVRRTRVYRIAPDVEVNMMRLSKLIAMVALNVMTEPTFKSQDGIFKKDRAGVVKKNEQGEPEYVDGLQFWLDKAAALQYKIDVEGLLSTEKITTVTKLEKKSIS